MMKRLILWVPLGGFLIFLGVVAAGLYTPRQEAVPSNMIGQPLPDFALQPPRPGEPDQSGTDPRAQALQALFGGPQPRAAIENNLLQVAHADRAALGARSVAGDPQTAVVSRGTLVQTILQLPAGDGQEARVTVPTGG